MEGLIEEGNEVTCCFSWMAICVIAVQLSTLIAGLLLLQYAPVSGG